MYTLRLFHQDEPFQQIEARILADGALCVGRDAEADWALPDESRTLSRRHCTFAVDDGRLILRDGSANGVFVGQARKRLPHDLPTPVEPGETIRLGDYMIVVEAAASAAAPEPRPALALAAEPAEIPTNWPSAPQERPVVADASLMEAFCAGARLDASAFSGEDPTQVMRRLGAVYQQMVLGLASLMTERTIAKTEYHLERTTLRAGGNNPFRWAPAERVAVDLLRPREDGFLSGAAAVQLSFSDLNKHLVCTLAGVRASVAATWAALDPARFDEPGKGGINFALKNRGAEAWARYVEAYGEARKLTDDEQSPANRAFRDAYEAQRQALESNRTVA
jgi:predicted component of type VI protein secretion system